VDLRLDDNVRAALRAALTTSTTAQFVADPDGYQIEVIEKGYTLHDKVIRYAKVVVGE